MEGTSDPTRTARTTLMVSLAMKLASLDDPSADSRRREMSFHSGWDDTSEMSLGDTCMDRSLAGICRDRSNLSWLEDTWSKSVNWRQPDTRGGGSLPAPDDPSTESSGGNIIPVDKTD